MSKIMQQLYAEARAAREAAAGAAQRPSGNTRAITPNPATPSSIDWWKAQYEQAGRAAVCEAAIAATKHPCSPRELIDYWTHHRCAGARDRH